MFQKDERLALFIDGSNLYATARALGFDIDYKRLYEYFADRSRLIRAYYYTALVEDQEYVQNMSRRNGAVAISALNRATLRPLVETMEVKLGLLPEGNRIAIE